VPVRSARRRQAQCLGAAPLARSKRCAARSLAETASPNRCALYDSQACSSSTSACSAGVSRYASLLALAGDAAIAMVQLDRSETLALQENRLDLVCLCGNYQSIARADLSPQGRTDTDPPRTVPGVGRSE